MLGTVCLPIYPCSIPTNLQFVAPVCWPVQILSCLIQSVHHFVRIIYSSLHTCSLSLFCWCLLSLIHWQPFVLCRYTLQSMYCNTTFERWGIFLLFSQSAFCVHQHWLSKEVLTTRKPFSFISFFVFWVFTSSRCDCCVFVGLGEGGIADEQLCWCFTFSLPTLAQTHSHRTYFLAFTGEDLWQLWDWTVPTYKVSDLLIQPAMVLVPLVSE